jgi:hypothetical protein
MMEHVSQTDVEIPPYCSSRESCTYQVAWQGLGKTNISANMAQTLEVPAIGNKTHMTPKERGGQAVTHARWARLEMRIFVTGAGGFSGNAREWQ